LHRLRVAGADRPVFTADGLREIAVWSQGIPRLVNMIAGAALVSGARQNAATIDAAIVRLEQSTTTVDRSGAREDRRLGQKESRPTPAAGWRASEVFRLRVRRRPPVARPEPAPDREAGPPPSPPDASGSIPPASKAPAPAQPAAAAPAANGPRPGLHRDPGGADGSRGATTTLATGDPAAIRQTRAARRTWSRLLGSPDVGPESAGRASRDASSSQLRRWRITAGIALAALVVVALMWWTAEVRRVRPVPEPPVPEPAVADRPLPPPPAPSMATRQAELPAPTAESDRPVQAKPLPVQPSAAQQPAPPSPPVPVRAVEPSVPVRPRPAPPADSARPARSADSAAVRRPGGAAVPAQSGDRAGEPDPTAIIDWLLQNR